jgi:hypothetical protein
VSRKRAFAELRGSLHLNHFFGDFHRDRAAKAMSRPHAFVPSRRSCRSNRRQSGDRLRDNRRAAPEQQRCGTTQRRFSASRPQVSIVKARQSSPMVGCHPKEAQP